MKRIFICYSHKDNPWKERLETYLKILKNIGWSTWSDSDIAMGDEWESEIDNNLDEADIALLLISNDFLISEYIQEKELPRLLKRKEKGEIELFPILLRPCLWTEYKWLSKRQLRPKGGVALSGGTDFEVESNLTEITGEITTILRHKENIEIIEPEMLIAKKVKAPEKKIDFFCKGRPELLLASKQPKFILTQANECILIDNHQLKQLPIDKRYAIAVLGPQNQLVIGLYEKELAILRDNAWSFIPMDGVPLSMARWDNKIVIGDSAQRIIFLSDDNFFDIRAVVPAPIIQIMPLNQESILLLDLNGKIWEFEEHSDTVVELQSDKINSFGRIYEMEPGLTTQSICLIGHKKMGVYNLSNKQLKLFKEEFPCGLRKVIGGLKNYFVLTDQGQLLILSKNLLQIRYIFQKEKIVVINLSVTQNKAVLAWTEHGNLYQVEESGAYQKISSNKTVFAYEDSRSKHIHAFQKTEKGYSMNII